MSGWMSIKQELILRRMVSLAEFCFAVGIIWRIQMLLILNLCGTGFVHMELPFMNCVLLVI